MSEQRRQEIVARVRQDGLVPLGVLAADLGVSEMTVRRDLDELTARGELVRVRGGARSLSHLGGSPLPVAPPPATAASGASPLPAPAPARAGGLLDERVRSAPSEVRGRRSVSPVDEIFGGRHEQLDRLAPPRPSARSPRAPAGAPDQGLARSGGAAGRGGRGGDPLTGPSAAHRSGPRLLRDASGDPDALDAPRAAGLLADQLARVGTALLDAGTGVRSVARALAPRLDRPAPDRLQVITRDPAIADDLAGAADVLLTGGTTRAPGAGLTGPWAQAPLLDVHADAAVLAVTGLDASGWWCPSPDDLAWARAAAAAAEALYVLLPASSIGRRAGVRGGGLADLSLVVIAGTLDLSDDAVQEAVAALQDTGTRLVLAG